MAAFKLEDNIREKLEEREIKPSESAWDKLEMRLDEQEPKKKSFAWLYIAASIIGLVFLTTVFIDRNPISQENSLVNIDALENPTESQTKLTEGIEKKNTSEGQELPADDETKRHLKPIVSKKSAIDKKVEKTEVATSLTTEKKELTTDIDGLNILEEEHLIDTKVEEVVAQIQKLDASSQEITLEEVELLLETARREIQTQRLLKTPKVDAMALLQDVEWELERSFRDKVFDALGEGFHKIRTAYSERNN